jgi:hypothetical protein
MCLGCIFQYRIWGYPSTQARGVAGRAQRERFRVANFTNFYLLTRRRFQKRQ